MRIAIKRSLGIPVPMPAKKVAYKKTAGNKKPAAKKVTDIKKPTPITKITVDTLYGNKVTSGEVTIKQDKATGKVNLTQEFDKETEEQTSRSEEPKSKQNKKGKKKSVTPSKPVKEQQVNASTNSSATGGDKIDDTNVSGPKMQVPSKDESTEKVSSDQGKSGSSVSSDQVAQSNANHQSEKKMTAQQWGSRFVHIHQERTTKKVRAQEFTRPESFKDRMIREGKSHPDPKDPSFPQYFKAKAIRNTSQEQEQRVPEADIDGNLTNTAETPSSAMPNSEVTPKRAGGFCTTLTNIFIRDDRSAVLGCCEPSVGE
jgi:hypothetical protein